MRPWVVVLGLGLLIAVGTAGAIGARARFGGGPSPPPPPRAEVLYRLIADETLRVDLSIPSVRPAPWVVFVHERGFPAPDEKEREAAGIADALQQRGIAVASLSFSVKEGDAPRRAGEAIASAIRELMRRGSELGLAGAPVLAGDEAQASLVSSIALDARYGLTPVASVIAMNGIYEGSTAADPDSPLAHVRESAPRFLLLSARDSPRSAQSSRTFARALEGAGAKGVRAYHASLRDGHNLGNLSGESNDVCDLVVAWIKEAPTPGGAEGAWALSDTWASAAPLSSEAFWAQPGLVVQRPTDAHFRARLRNLYGEIIHDLDPWPLATYSAINLGDYLRAHPELGSGDWLESTNARGEKLVLSRAEIERKKPLLVIGVDDERNLFRLFVTYNVHRTYSWKPEAEARPLLVRSVGAFLYVPTEPEAPASGSLHPVTGADFALVPSSFKVVASDPLARARGLPKPVAGALTNEQGCLQCHALHGEGGRAHHLRAANGKVAEAFGLALEEYPAEVMRRFLFEQNDVAKSFGVSPLALSEPTAKLLLAEIIR